MSATIALSATGWRPGARVPYDGCLDAYDVLPREFARGGSNRDQATLFNDEMRVPIDMPEPEPIDVPEPMSAPVPTTSLTYTGV